MQYSKNILQFLLVKDSGSKALSWNNRFVVIFTKGLSRPPACLCHDLMDRDVLFIGFGNRCRSSAMCREHLSINTAKSKSVLSPPRNRVPRYGFMGPNITNKQFCFVITQNLGLVDVYFQTSQRANCTVWLIGSNVNLRMWAPGSTGLDMLSDVKGISILLHSKML